MIGIFEAIITVIVISTLEKVIQYLLAWNNLKNSKTDNTETEPMEAVAN